MFFEKILFIYQGDIITYLIRTAGKEKAFAQYGAKALEGYFLLLTGT
jgi:hypothetical protein